MLAHKEIEKHARGPRGNDNLKKLGPTLALIHKQPVDLFIGVTHALGYILGEKLFYAMVAGKISKTFLRELYQDPFTRSGRARARYFELVELMRDVAVPERT